MNKIREFAVTAIIVVWTICWLPLAVACWVGAALVDYLAVAIVWLAGLVSRLGDAIMTLGKWVHFSILYRLGGR
jgi:hypothetical protein